MAGSGLTAAGAVLSILFLICLGVFVAQPFPFQALGTPASLVQAPVPPEDFSTALWSLRSWDAVILSSVLLFSAIGCVALFRMEE